MNIVKATRNYERWLSAQLDSNQLEVDQEALGVKHDEMPIAPFAFLRATYYRWIQLWPDNLALYAKAPELLGVGDLHVQNFGTWRDSEGRLVWGINDFDEASPLPYTQDLVRLATSAQLAITDNRYLATSFATACARILEGYESTLRAGIGAASPLVLSEDNDWLREIAADQIKEPRKFWDKLDYTPPTTPGTPPNGQQASTPDGASALEAQALPVGAQEAIKSRLPSGAWSIKWKRRQAGLGSLGRPRFVALAVWQGGRVAREGKALVPSAAFWQQEASAGQSFLSDILARATRCPDPHFNIQGHWLVRRLAPDCTKVELFDVPKKREEQFLVAMGRETANIHLGTASAIPHVLAHLRELPTDWLEQAARECAKHVLEDWNVWKRHHPPPRTPL